MEQTVLKSERPHIVLYGEVNIGKSSLFNLLLGQEASVVSDIPGTTTDVVTKSMELPGVGAVVLVDTPGMGDGTLLGLKRMEATKKALQRADAILYLCSQEKQIDEKLEKQYPGVKIIPVYPTKELYFLTPDERRQKVIALISEALVSNNEEERTITGSLAKRGDLVLLVIPQDKAAPKGRLILPQVQTIRELLDKSSQVLCLQPSELESGLEKLSGLPDLVITDSQVFREVEQVLPSGVPLTSFSILMSAHKGSFPQLLAGAEVLSRLSPDARVLIAEACSHAPTTEDIGRVKLPKMLRKKYGEQLLIDHINGNDFPADLSKYDLIIHCGACMFNRQHLLNRQRFASEQGVPMTNYGLAIAAIQGLLPRVALPE